jgi:pyruvate formate lyase activating enzyme
MMNPAEPLTGTVFDIRRFTMGDGPGVRTTIFMKGCPLRCAWCHNPEGRNPYPDTIAHETTGSAGERVVHHETIGREYTPEELMEIILKERGVMTESGGGVTFSGGEPLLQHPFLLTMLKRCREEGLHTAIDTNGYAEREVLESVLPYTDLFLFDFKHADREKHLDFTAVSTKTIIGNLGFLLHAGAKVWIRIPVVPGFNYSRTDMAIMIQTLKGMPEGIEEIQLIPYRKVPAAKYRHLGYENSMGDTPSLKDSQLNQFRRMFRRAGFKQVS